MKFERFFDKKEIAPNPLLELFARQKQPTVPIENPSPLAEPGSVVNAADMFTEVKYEDSAKIAQEIAEEEEQRREIYARLFGGGPHIF